MTSAYREWEPLTHIVGRIPPKYQRGLFTTDIQITSGDVHGNVVALGSNVPTIYLFDRLSGALTNTLKFGKGSDRVTALAIQESLEVVVAAGTERGLVYIFQLPSPLPGRCKELKQFVLPHQLKKDVTSVCLSVNCLRLFAGDSSGAVISATIDYDKGECASDVVHKELTAVVQLSYTRGLLLVTSLAQAILYDCESRTCTKIGSQDRKVLGKFGGQFSHGDFKKADAVVYVSRPSYRLWCGDASGQVKATLVFKELLENAPEIQLAVSPGGRLTEQVTRGSGSSTTSSLSSAFVDQFGEMLLLSDNRMVIWNDSALYIIDVALSTILGVCRDVGPIIHVFAKSSDEIFILRTGVQRRLIRLGLAPLSSSMAPAPAAAASASAAAVLVHGERTADAGSVAATALSRRNSPAAVTNAPVSVAAAQAPLSRPLLDGLLLEQERRAVHGQPEQQQIPAVVRLAASELATLHIDESSLLPPPPPLRPAQESSSSTASRIQLGLDHMKKGLSDLVKGATAAGRRTGHSLQQPSSDLLPLQGVGRQGPGTATSSSSAAISISSPAVGSNGRAPAGIIASLPPMRSFDDDPALVTRMPVRAPKTERSGGSSPTMQLRQQPPSHRPISDAAASSLGATPAVRSTNDVAPRAVNSASSASADSEPLADGQEAASTESPDARLMGHTDCVVLSQDELQVTASDDDATEETAELQGVAATGKVKPAKESRKGKKPSKEPKKKKKVGEAEIAASERFRTLYDRLASGLVLDVPSVVYEPDLGNVESDVDRSVADKESCDVAPPPLAQPPLLHAEHLDGSRRHQPVGQCDSAATGAPIDDGVSAAVADKLSNALAASDADGLAEPETPSTDRGIYDLYGAGALDGNGEASTTALVGAQGAAVSDEGGHASTSDQAVALAADGGGSSTLSSEGSRANNSTSTRSVWPMVSEQWTEWTALKPVKYAAVSSLFVVCVDKDDAVHYVRLKDSGSPEWKKLEFAAVALSLSPSGDVWWRLAPDGTAFAGSCRAQVTSPSQIKWTEAVHGGVGSIAVGESAAWYIKENGCLCVHDGVSKDRPMTRSAPVKCGAMLAKVAGRKNKMLWGLTADAEVLRYDGETWRAVPSPPGSQMICDVAFGWEDTAWVADCSGRVWFTDVVSRLKEGDDASIRRDACWWQVSCHCSFSGSSKRKDGGQRLPADKRNKCLVGVADGVVVMSIEPRKTLQVRQGHVVGHQWLPMSFPGIALSSRWDLVYTNDSENLWLIQAGQELFCYSTATRRIRTILLPERHGMINVVSGSGDVLWVLFDDGGILVSTTSHGYPGPSGSVSSSDGNGRLIGLTWTELDLSQLSEVRLRHVSVGREYVWAVDEYGTVYMRIGIMPKQNRHMSPAWAPVDIRSPQMNAHFVSVHVSDDGRTVWALDSKDNAFARRGISEQMPMGVSWVQVIGSPVRQLILTGDAAWALTPDGEAMCRAGLTSSNIAGDYWKVLPGGAFKYLTASLKNYVWAVSAEGQVLEHRCKMLGRVTQRPQQQRHDSDIDPDWELV